MPLLLRKKERIAAEMRALYLQTHSTAESLVEEAFPDGSSHFSAVHVTLAKAMVLPCRAWEKMPAETLEISAAAVSGDGSINNVGIRMAGTFQCPECPQKFVLASANIMLGQPHLHSQ